MIAFNDGAFMFASVDQVIGILLCHDNRWLVMALPLTTCHGT